MVIKKKAASKSTTAQPMDSPSASINPTPQSSPTTVETALLNKPSWQVDRVKVQNDGSNSTKSTLPPLPKERVANQPAIITFFRKSPKKPPKEQEQLKKDDKQKSIGKNTTKKTMSEVKKIAPRKSTKGASANTKLLTKMMPKLRSPLLTPRKA